MDYTGMLSWSLLLAEEKRLWLHAEKRASNKEPSAKRGRTTYLLCATWILKDASVLNLFLHVLSQHSLVSKKSACREFNTE